MQNSSVLLHQDTFKNPFDDINANTIDPRRILDLWCDPFAVELLKGMNAGQFATSKMPIILQGSRGSGKTTILKYFSYSVLKERAKRDSHNSLIEQIKKEKSLGFYFRCDDSFVNTFQSIFKSVCHDNWLISYEHYFELQLCAQILSVIKELSNDPLFDEMDFFNIAKAESMLFEEYQIDSLSKLDSFIKKQLYYINTYRNELIFRSTQFAPHPLLNLYAISEVLLNSLNKTIIGFDKVTYLVLIDEFENMTEEMQTFFNTKIKFSHNIITYRIGRRSEGTTTTKTINATEYLRKDHDYILVCINSDLGEKHQKEYFSSIATKRLISANSECTNIGEILGLSEDLDRECLALCKKDEKHLRIVLSERSEIKQNPEIYERVKELIKYPSNPIMETLNALWVIRRKESPIEAARITKVAMEDYLAKTKNDNSTKYYNDYMNKYRYAITTLLSSIYKQDKLYYSFNTIVYLADGNARAFINICRAIFNDAWFYERESFLTNHVITPSSQSRAIHEFSNSEFESVCSIIDYGSSIRNLLLNIGNTLSSYHKDKKARYPETTQFTFDYLQITGDDKKIVDTAISWTMIIKRNKKQRLSTGIKQKGDIYYINRAFAPLFNISYRIRGGYNVRFSTANISDMIKQELVTAYRDVATQAQEGPLSLFDYEEC